MQPDRNLVIGLVVIVLGFVPLLFERLNSGSDQSFAASETCKQAGRNGKDDNRAPFYTNRNVHQHGLTKQTHASALTELDNGALLATWYGGTREGSTDSAIYTAMFNPDTHSWQPSQIIANRITTGLATRRYVKKVGNPVIKRDNKGKLHLFYVSVSVGGWSGSAVNYILSTDNGKSWSAPRRLISSPFFNLSTLVKGEPLLMKDGSLAIPVYHELMGKFGEVLYFHPDKGVITKTRISYGRASLQPSVAAFDDTSAVALLRYAGKDKRRVQYVHTGDAGKSWSGMAASNLPNPNAAVSVRCIDKDTLLMAFNNTEKGRYDLSLAISRDKGINWNIIHKIEYAPDAESEQRFSYPYMIEDSDSNFHISYTWNKQIIKHVSFNRAWLGRKIQ